MEKPKKNRSHEYRLYKGWGYGSPLQPKDVLFAFAASTAAVLWYVWILTH